jgi:hypothetical protein
MRLSGEKKPVILTNYYNKTVLLPLCDNKCNWNKQKSVIKWGIFVIKAAVEMQNNLPCCD